MRTKTKILLAASVTGIILVVSVIMMADSLENPLRGLLMASGAGLFSGCFSYYRTCRREELDPAFGKENQIRREDERNAAIRSKAAAVSGNVLHWLLFAGGFFSLGLGAPLWVTLALWGSYLLKLLLESCLIAHYSKNM